jgi:hypothetical protein
MTEEIHAFWTPVYNAFNPWEPLHPGQMADWYVARPHSPLQALVAELSPDRGTQRVLLLGHRSSGKSTEMVKLGTELARRFNYLVVRIDLDQNLDPGKINPIEVLFLLGAAVYKVARQELEQGPDEALLDRLVGNLETLVREHTESKTFEVDKKGLLDNLVCFGAGLVAGPVAAGVMKAVTNLIPVKFASGTDIQLARKLEVQPQVREILATLNAIIADAEQRGQRPVFLIVDGLDRVPNMEMARYVFAENEEWLDGPVCNVLYTAPIMLYYSPVFGHVRSNFDARPFPNVKVHWPHQLDDPGTPEEAGYQVMRAVVHRRLRQPLGLEPDEVIVPRALDHLIDMSGGVMRDLIRLVREATVKAELAGQRRIDLEVADQTVLSMRRDYKASLNVVYRQELAEVLRSHEVTGSEKCDELLLGNYVLSYVNDGIWFDVHSVILPLL